MTNNNDNDSVPFRCSSKAWQQSECSYSALLKQNAVINGIIKYKIRQRDLQLPTSSSSANILTAFISYSPLSVITF